MKRVERGEGRRDGEEKEETRCLASIFSLTNGKRGTGNFVFIIE